MAATGIKKLEVLIRVCEHDPAHSARARKSITLGNMEQILARSDETHGPFECEIVEQPRATNGHRTFVVHGNRALDVVNTSSEAVNVRMEVPDARTLDYIIHPGGHLYGLYGDFALVAHNTGMSFGKFTIGKMSGTVTNNPGGSTASMSFTS